MLDDRPEDDPPDRGRWAVVALLWFCGFFNYADRQAVFSVFPLLRGEFAVSDTDKGMIGSAFMVVYAIMSPFTGLMVDRFSRRRLVVLGLAAWSVICALTATAGRFWQLLAFRAAEGLGESFYFPASMSLLAGHHGPRTRSRAMSLHQTSVYAGTAVGGILAGYLGGRFGWRSPFWALGLVGLAYAAWLPTRLREPPRSKADAPPGDPRRDLAAVLRTPAAVALLATFAGANFVAMALLAWLPDFVFRTHELDLFGSALVATLFMPSANLVGALLGGVLADRLGARPGGRAAVQGAALLLGAPCVFLAGRTGSLPVLIAALIGIGLCKGVYDANIFASLYDVVRPEIRGFAAGLMNTVGWAGASLAPLAIGLAIGRFGLGASIASTACLYLAAGALALVASRLARRGSGKPERSADFAD
jgi:predicted MFS family arabinose efflux permease